jgi:carboxypeptidase family protein/TonB-dependent receptor-like protein
MCTALVVLAPAAVGFGQRTTATLAGIVTDPSGAVLPGASVELVNEGTSASIQQLTGETGEFILDYVPVGVYTLKITMPGFRTYESRSIPLGAGQNVRRTYVMEVGSISDSVTVTGEAPMVNTLSPEQRINLTTTEVIQLPMANRNITNVLQVGSGLTVAAADSGGRGGNRFRLNGLGGSSMSVMADGSDANGNPGGSQMISNYGAYNKIDIMSSEAVAEVQVVKGVMPAEYGYAMAGNMSVITKSGTNEWHGSLFHRYEGSALSARLATLNFEPNSVWNQFGGSLGGQIKKDRAFFFAAYEGYRQRTSVLNNPIVPTPRFRDILMTSMPHPETKLLLDYYPLPNQPYGANDLLASWIGPGAVIANDDHVDFKIDYLVGGGNFSLSFAGGHPYLSKAEQGGPLDPQVITNTKQRATFNYVKGWGPWTSSTRGGYNRSWAAKIDKFWYVRDPNTPETVSGWRRVWGIGYPGMASLNSQNQTRGLTPAWQFSQQFARLSGTHSIKFGGILSLPGGGRFSTQGGTVNYQTLDDVQKNTPSTVAFQAGTNAFKQIMRNFGFFMQDDWRVNRKLVLNLGIRYDRLDHFVPKGWDGPDCLCNLEGLLNAETFQWGPLRPIDNPFNSDPFSFAPRFGFAYTPDNRGDFVVRGGFGVNFQAHDLQLFDNETARTAYLPASRTFTRAEAAARGLKYPAYTDDVAKLLEAESNGKVQISTRIEPNLKPPYALNYTLGIQRALTPSLMLETAFVGTRGVKFPLTRTANNVDRITGLRPNPNDLSIKYIDSSQQTNYNSWQTSVTQRMSHGMLFNVHYTWGKAMAYTGGDISASFNGDTFAGIEDFSNVKIERSPASGDITHEIIGDWVYQVPTPFADSVIARQILGGWNISGIWSVRTGVPLQITQTGGRPDLLDIKGAINDNCCGFGSLQYLNKAAFQLVPLSSASNRTVRRGSMANGAVRGPGSSNIDLSLAKKFSVTEGKDLELKADMLNVLNHTRYSAISTNMSAITFGQAIGTAPARVIQLQLRLSF